MLKQKPDLTPVCLLCPVISKQKTANKLLIFVSRFLWGSGAWRVEKRVRKARAGACKARAKVSPVAQQKVGVAIHSKNTLFSQQCCEKS
jgi:hypothetical protein